MSEAIVPGPDNVQNARTKEVIGQKRDAAVQAVGTTATMMAYLKGLVEAIGGAAGVVTFPASAAPGNGVSLAEVISQIYDQTGIGSEFWLKKTMVSSAILTSAVDLTGVASGELALEDIILKTGSTGLATGTNIEIETDNASGLADIMVETVANLGANKTVDLVKGSVSYQKTVIESGKKVTIKSTVAACTGAGTLDVYMRFRRLTAAATIAAA